MFKVVSNREVFAREDDAASRMRRACMAKRFSESKTRASPQIRRNGAVARLAFPSIHLVGDAASFLRRFRYSTQSFS